MNDELAFHTGLEKRMDELGQKVHPSIRRYLNYRPLCGQLPYVSKFGYELVEVNAFCKECSQPSRLLRGVVREWPNCIEVEGGGICKTCERVTYFKLRRYNDGRQSRQGDRGWVPVVEHKRQSPFTLKARLIFWNCVCRILDWLNARITGKGNR